MNEQEQFWSGDGGNAYTARNRVDWRARIPFWHDIMKFTGARSVYEVGCNAGWNLSAIAEVSKARLHGCDLNFAAVRQAQQAGLMVLPGAGPSGVSELVFTACVLIHVAPAGLLGFMRSLVNASSHYVLAIESESEVEEMIEYSGQSNLMWKRPYGKLYEALGLKVLHTGKAIGFNETYWLCEKP